MHKLIFVSPTGATSVDPDIAEIVCLVSAVPRAYWSQGCGNAALSYESRHLETELLILPHEEHGVYLKFIKSNVRKVEEEWLSLHDPALLAEVVECADRWCASIGLFLPPGRAALAVDDFCRTGLRSSGVTWIQPADLPTGGNC